MLDSIKTITPREARQWELSEHHRKLEKPTPTNSVWVRQRPDAWRKACYLISEVRDPIYWDMQPTILRGGVNCDEQSEGDLDDCALGEGPHPIEVYVLEKDNNAVAFRKLADRVGTKP